MSQIQYIDMRMSIEAFNTIKKLCDMAKEGNSEACHKLAGVMAVIIDRNLN